MNRRAALVFGVILTIWVLTRLALIVHLHKNPLALELHLPLLHRLIVSHLNGP